MSQLPQTVARCTPPYSCFDVFAGLWVFLYERSVPRAQREAQQGFLLDELHSSTVRLRARRCVWGVYAAAVCLLFSDFFQPGTSFP